jgi:putative hydroxymethylpyrimidine transport system permease protein
MTGIRRLRDSPWLRPLVTLAGVLTVWEAVVVVTGIPRFLLPGPGSVLVALIGHGPLIAGHAARTLAEMGLGLVLGGGLGMICAAAMAWFRPVRRWLMPALVVSQAVPVFALAPLLVLWFGYGMASKVAMTILVIFFPVTSAFFDGLRRTEPGWLDLARTMGGSAWTVLWRIRIPAALPALGSGLRVAVAVAPIGAVIGEWVGASAGLGYLMLQANARMQTDLMFAALLVLGLMAVTLYAAMDWGLRRLLPWQPDLDAAGGHWDGDTREDG